MDQTGLVLKRNRSGLIIILTIRLLVKMMVMKTRSNFR
jgi:hypothetical protein